MNYYIIIPAHNEERFIALTLESVINQTLLPKKMVIVNDNSSDATENIIDRYIAKHPWIEKVNKSSSNEHLPGSKVIEAFNEGLKKLDDDYDFIVKLDADLVLPENYFQSIGNTFANNTKVGIAGGFAYEQQNEGGEWKLNHPMNKDHVRGAFKAYSNTCFKKIGGLRNSMGWDTVDELLAQFHDFIIHTDESLKVKHLRPTGKSYNKKAKYMQGEAMYKMRYGSAITYIAALKMAIKNKKIAILFDCLKGYRFSKKKKIQFIVSEKEGAFIRKLRWNGILSKLK
ncbi:glycosyltransferase [Flavobacteriaceae bacterium R38]|nr:glycosyltransferase [Flavobacteriaceae bacterium R38]